MSQDLQALGKSLDSKDVTIRREAAETLARVGPEAVGVALPLVQACGDEDEEVRNWAVAALEELPAPNASNSAALEKLINGSNLDIAFWSATLLGRMAASAASAVPTLAKAVAAHPELVVRQRAAWALGKIGKPAAVAVPQLEAATASDDARLARFAAAALESIRS
ncbi:MAG: HEAT repeat domain-containing protein [Planctomycetaceae bacterium]|nr:HEAT repeat domain-containing protein [Planctomycetales bacterium]MCB9939508.1 HEAT repeat domain-containing protein [Planctomycetaceae bacterium]